MSNTLQHIPSVAVTEAELKTQTSYQRFSKTIELPGVHPADATIIDLMNAVEVSGTFEFWSDPEEEQYNENDGDAV